MWKVQHNSIIKQVYNLQLYPMKLTTPYEILASQSFNEINDSVMNKCYNNN